jgi:hypothetical protein
MSNHNLPSELQSWKTSKLFLDHPLETHLIIWLSDGIAKFLENRRDPYHTLAYYLAMM